MHTQKKGILYLIPTVLSDNAQDKSITPFSRRIIEQTTHYLVENARTARRFLSDLQLGIDIGNRSFRVVDKRTSATDIPGLTTPLLEGTNMALMSEAGCPGVADPGSGVVAWAHRHGVVVKPLVGPSSILLALMASGFSGQSFAFHGYLPIEEPGRTKAIRSMEKEALKTGQTQIFMETPYRNNQLLSALLATCRRETTLCIAANLTADEEFIHRKTIAAWRGTKTDLHKLPAMYLIGTP